MTMTKEKAARILDPETSRDALWEYEEEDRLEACNEACRVAAAALRAQPPNDPLTLEELREMDGEPVWIKEKHDQMPHCDVLHNVAKSEGRTYMRPLIRPRLQESGYGKTWIAYRRKPEGLDRRIGGPL